MISSEHTPIDRILMVLADQLHGDEVKRAHTVYFRYLPDLNEEDPSFERLTFCFHNWYVFDWQMESGRGTPLQVFLQQVDIPKDEWDEYAAMAANIHGMFEIDRIQPGKLILRNLFTEEFLQISERRHVTGLKPGDILEARLLPLRGVLVFSPGANVLHPRPARGAIHSIIHKTRREGKPSMTELIAKLQAASFRFTDRFRERVSSEKLYRELFG